MFSVSINVIHALLFLHLCHQLLRTVTKGEVCTGSRIQSCNEACTEEMTVTQTSSPCLIRKQELEKSITDDDL